MNEEVKLPRLHTTVELENAPLTKESIDTAISIKATYTTKEMQLAAFIERAEKDKNYRENFGDILKFLPLSEDEKAELASRFDVLLSNAREEAAVASDSDLNKFFAYHREHPKNYDVTRLVAFADEALARSKS